MISKGLQAEIGLSREGIVQRRRGQQALTTYRRLPELNLMAMMIKQGSQRFTCRTPVQAMAPAFCLAHDPGRFHQPLHVQHNIVIPLAQMPDKGPPFAAGLTREPLLAPTAMGNDNHLVY